MRTRIGSCGLCVLLGMLVLSLVSCDQYLNPDYVKYLSGSLEGHDYRVRDLAWSPDGTRLLSVAASVNEVAEGSMRVWDMRTGLEESGFRKPGCYVSAAWDPQNNWLVAVSSNDGEDQVAGACGDGVMALSTGDPISEIIFSADLGYMRQLVFAGAGLVRFGEFGSLNYFPLLGDDVFASENLGDGVAMEVPCGSGHISASRGGARLVSRQYSCEADESPRRCKGQVYLFRFDDQANTWSAAEAVLPSGENLADIECSQVSYPQYDAGVLSAVFSPVDEDLLVMGDTRGRLLVWNASTKVLQTVATVLREVNGLAFSPDGQWLAAAGDLLDDDVGGQTLLYRVSDWQRVWKIGEGNDFMGLALAFSPDGKILASGGDGRIKLWNMDKVFEEIVD